ncbi:Alpha-1,2-mannosyltransferase [Venturia inaequalis]|nr:Alpha-1,2-mannosyltransferase [Venturia inaequalis]
MLSSYAGEEVKVQQALASYRAGQYSSIRKATTAFGARYSMLRSRANGIGTKIDRLPANKLLRPAEEDGLLI